MLNIYQLEKGVWEATDVRNFLRQAPKEELLRVLDNMQTWGFKPGDVVIDSAIQDESPHTKPKTLLSYTALPLYSLDGRDAWVIAELMKRGERKLHVDSKSGKLTQRVIDVCQSPLVLAKLFLSSTITPELIDIAFGEIPLFQITKLFDSNAKVDLLIDKVSYNGVKRLALHLSHRYGNEAVSLLTDALTLRQIHQNLIDDIPLYIANADGVALEQPDYPMAIKDVSAFLAQDNATAISQIHRVGNLMAKVITVLEERENETAPFLKSSRSEALSAVFNYLNSADEAHEEMPIALLSLSALLALEHPMGIAHTVRLLIEQLEILKNNGRAALFPQIFDVIAKASDGGMLGSGKHKACYIVAMWSILRPSHMPLQSLVKDLDKKWAGWQVFFATHALTICESFTARERIVIGSEWARNKVALLLDNMSVQDALEWVERQSDVKYLLTPSLISVVNPKSFSTIKKTSVVLALAEHIELELLLPVLNSKMKAAVMKNTLV